MKSIRISKDNRVLLKQNGGTYIKNINELYDKVEPYMPYVDYSSVKSHPLKVDDETYYKLKSLAISDNESIDNIITRMFLMLSLIEE